MTLPHGDYTRLATDYANFRPGYAPELPGKLLGLTECELTSEIDFVDVGAGTGIWTRMVAASGCKTTAVEPNAAMRAMGASAQAAHPIVWREGSGEATGLPENSADLLTMASSFHWTDFERSTAAFARVLRPAGVFAALWNTRHLEATPLLIEIEAELERRVPDLERVSSGRSAFCEGLTERLAACGHFTDVQYIEGRHTERMDPERYLGIWRSVNDVRVQAGEERFDAFLGYVAEQLQDLEHVDAVYSTRAWVARVPASG